MCVELVRVIQDVTVATPRKRFPITEPAAILAGLRP